MTTDAPDPAWYEPPEDRERCPCDARDLEAAIHRLVNEEAGELDRHVFGEDVRKRVRALVEAFAWPGRCVGCEREEP